MRRLLALLLLLTAVLGLTPAAATATPTLMPHPTVLDGMRIGQLPGGLGASTDFRYEFDDVAFVSRVWESRTPDGGYREDLAVDVLRGARLADAADLHDWFIAYGERPADVAHYLPTTVRGRPGWLGADELFWLVRPGLAMVVRLDTARWSQRELARTARSVSELTPPRSARAV